MYEGVTTYVWCDWNTGFMNFAFLEQLALQSFCFLNYLVNKDMSFLRRKQVFLLATLNLQLFHELGTRLRKQRQMS